MTIVQVKGYHGAPTLYIDGVPQPALVFWGPSGESFYRASPDILANLARAGTGVHIYSYPTDLDWMRPGVFDYASIDAVVKTLCEADPQAYLLPRVDCNSPTWWDELHPEELTRFHDGSPDRNARASYASELWKRETGDALARYVAHMRAGPYGQHFLGYHVAVGYTGEWNRYLAQAGFSWDYSQPMVERFQGWLRVKYADDVSALKAAWKDEGADFATAQVPDREADLRTELYTFRDPSAGRRVIDYYLFLSELVAEDICLFCRIAKEASHNESLAGVFYGYVMETWPGAFFPEQGFMAYETSYWMNQQQRWGHQALMKVLDCPYVDFLCSPNSYFYRCIGGEAAPFSATETIRLHGKLWFCEDDTSTFLSEFPNGVYGKCETLAESVEVLRRNFANTLIRGVGQWWMNLGQREWFNHPELLERIAEMKRIADWDLDQDHSLSGEGVAVIVDETSPCYQGVSANLMYPLITLQKQLELGRMGTPYAVYLHDDLGRADMPDYKCYLFLNTFYLSPEEREVIKRKVCKNGSVAVWVYAPGILDDQGLSAEKMHELTGIRLAYDVDQWGLKVVISDFEHPLTHDLATNTCFGTDNLIGPIVYADDPQARTLGLLIYNQGRCKPGFCLKGFEDWTSIFIGAPVIPAQVLRNIARFARVHIYSDALDVLYANERFLAIHSKRAGAREISLPRRADVYDVFGKREVARGVRRFVDFIPAYTTVLYYTGDLARVKGLSA